MSSDRVKPAIRVQAVSKTFGNGVVVDRVSFSVEQGTCFGLLGPNGAGKSTTLKMIYGSLRPSAGEILVEGLDVMKNPRAVKRRLGIAPQDDTLDPDLSVEKNLLFHARYSGIPGREGRDRIRSLLEMMGLDDHADAAMAQLSSGLRRRLVLARALINNPRIVILDESTRGLDHESRAGYLETLQEMKQRGATLILATHEFREAEALCDRAALMDRGRILEVGSAREILPRAASRRT